MSTGFGASGCAGSVKPSRSSLGALLTFDFANIRYMTATHIGTWAMDKLIRFAVLPRGGDPVVWDFGSAARHHQLFNPWLDGEKRARAGISTLRGAFHPDAGVAEEVAHKVAAVLREHGLEGEPGVDVVEMPILAALRAEGLEVVDGQQVFLEARRIKTADEIGLLTQACSMVDAAYESSIPSCARECAKTSASSRQQGLYDLGSEYVEGVNAISGERCSPHPHVYSDRVVRPGDPAFFDILHSHLGYRTCYYRCFAVGSASPAMRDVHPMPRVHGHGDRRRQAGATTADIVQLWPRAEEFGFANEEAAFALQYGHGVGLAIWEKPIFSRLVSLEHPETLEEGMVLPSRRIGRHPTAGQRHGSRRRWSSPPTAARSSRSSPPRSFWLPASGTGASTVRSRPSGSRSRISTRPRVGESRDHRHAPGRRGHPARPVRADGRHTTHRAAAHDLFLRGLVKGTTHLAAGQEAVAVGASAALRPTTTSSPPTVAITMPSLVERRRRSAWPS